MEIAFISNKMCSKKAFASAPKEAESAAEAMLNKP